MVRKVPSRKKLTLLDRSDKENSKISLSSARLEVQSPKQLTQPEGSKLALRKEEQPKPTLQDYITQYQSPEGLKITQMGSENSLLKPQTVKNASSYGVLLRQTLSGEKSLLSDKQYYISSVVAAIANKKPSSFDQLCCQHIHASYEFLSYVKREKVPIPSKPKNSVKLHKNSPLKKHTIIFDLDETLIHCHDGLKSPVDVRLPVKFPDGNVISVCINVRPYAKECLKELSKYFEIMVFTASHECYARVVVNYLDPEGKYIEHFLSREDCHRTASGFYVKDLRILDRDLSNVLLVDNAAYSYCFQPENGVPIVPFYDNKADLELKALVSYLKQFKDESDVRSMNNKIMKLTEYTKFRNLPELVQVLYGTHNSLF